MPQVPLKRTPIDSKTYARAVLSACRSLGWPPLNKGAIGVLWAQYMVETGGRACWNFNLGNVKVTQAQVDDGAAWHDLPGTWEIIKGKRVVLPEGDAGRRFRAYESLADGMVEHLAFLRNRRYKNAWPSVEAGDCDGFARRLKASGYYTASADDYARGMLGHWRKWMASPVFASVIAEADTLPSLPVAEEPPSEPTMPVAVPEMREPPSYQRVVIVHPKVPLGRPALDGDFGETSTAEEQVRRK